ncbi:hypothetical protein MPC4_330008 [Methylocella tundrae]|uniref:PIN domain-containing protein n=1 Tax=Methylocella tundrae TaxID=227605 RepID=A0A8B6M8S3_METTU|nr:hypothetical protein MPC1_3420007 [Methylocella tundrae]VTZ51208.1 hypothetical protein MPC4_330008 [Methylocella tundrae]
MATSDAPLIGGALLLDTCVYLDALQGRTPGAADALLSYRVCYHSAVCLAELTHAFGRLDPAHSSTKTALKTIGDVIADIPGRRLHAPESAAWGEAGARRRAVSSERPATRGGPRAKTPQ